MVFAFVELVPNADNGYVFTTMVSNIRNNNIMVEQFSGVGQISAGVALTKTGNQLDVAVDDLLIEVSSDAHKLRQLTGQTINTLGTIVTGIGIVIDEVYGSTGQLYTIGDACKWR